MRFILAISESAADEPEKSGIQRERVAMLKVYESPHNLTVSLFAKLAGKSCDQINREIKAGKLLTLNIGNRGQRIPDWRLEPVKVRLVQKLRPQTEAGSWPFYRPRQYATTGILSCPKSRLIVYRASRPMACCSDVRSLWPGPPAVGAFQPVSVS
ncbi:hypothetical protein [Brenneria goodwinii]